MIRTLCFLKSGKVAEYEELKQAFFHDEEILWFWTDFDTPTEEENQLLHTFFRFHPLAIEDCIYRLQRPKLDHYDSIHFFVLHALREDRLTPEEVNLFLAPNYLVTYHHQSIPEIGETWERIYEKEDDRERSPLFMTYLLLDNLVDHYFPVLEEMDRKIDAIDDSPQHSSSIQKSLNQIYELRADLLRIRRTLVPMRDLLYRILNTSRIDGLSDHLFYFRDIYDHLTKLSERLEEFREMTADLRDSTLSLYSFRMNNIMKTLTVITTIFMPLTFIAGIYGMNFHYMPELTWPFGYFLILSLMGGITLGMLYLFFRKGWFR